MKARHPATDPRQGDVLAFKGWTVTVEGRSDDGAVLYVRSQDGKPPEGRRTQDIVSWSAWASLAKVLSTGDECVPFEFGIAGKCTACHQQLGAVVHTLVDRGIFCAACCPAAKHGKPKKARAKEKAA